MRDFTVVQTPVPNRANDTIVTCKTSGKPITVSNKYGMFCEDQCDLQECKVIAQQLKRFIPGIF